MADVESEPHISGDIADTLLGWYDVHARSLPWRAAPGLPAPDPYRVWLSEIMLQQTTVAAVIPYFERFIQRWPTVAALAGAEDAELMAAWAGLGYYARARNLLACARAVVRNHCGQFPDEEAALKALPGIGGYTAAAIAAIAFDKYAVVVDANVERVIARLNAIETPLPAAKVEIREGCRQLTPHTRPGDFAQAMMDLGATVCTPRNPACTICPLTEYCTAYRMEIVEQLPRKPAKSAKPHRFGIAYWIEQDDHVWLVQRPANGLLAGMRALPDDQWKARQDGNGGHPFEGSWRRHTASVDHVFTHFSLTLAVDVADGTVRDDTLPTGVWWPIKALDSAGLPTLFMKAAKAVLAQREN